MKLKLEFEDKDFGEMVSEYFRMRGFTVLNLNDIIARFKKPYPEGLIVEASQSNGKTASPIIEEETERVPAHVRDRATLSQQELLDPEKHIPEVEEMEVQEPEDDAQGIQRILKISRTLQEEKGE